MFAYTAHNNRAAYAVMLRPHDSDRTILLSADIELKML